MSDPKRFRLDDAQVEAKEHNYRIDFINVCQGAKTTPEIIVYRYCNRYILASMESRRRKDGNLTPLQLTLSELNDFLLRHTHRVPPESPFVSVVLSWEALYNRSEGQALESIESAPHIVAFAVTPDKLYRPSIPSYTTKAESEWCVLDFPEPLSLHFSNVMQNPYYNSQAAVPV